MASIKVTPFCRATRIISLASFALEARGFSQRTCFPCCMKRILKAACKELGTAIYTASIKELAAISSGEVKRCGMLCLRAKAWPVSLLREQTAVASKRNSSRAASRIQSVIKLVPIIPKRTFLIL